MTQHEDSGTWSHRDRCCVLTMTRPGRSGAGDISAERRARSIRPKNSRSRPAESCASNDDCDQARLAALRRTITSWPVTDVTVLGPESPSALWVGTRRGAIRYSDGYRRHEYFAGTALAARRRGHRNRRRRRRRWLETPKGYSRGSSTADDAGGEVAGVRPAHPGAARPLGPDRRFQLRVPGDVSTNQTGSTDNDGLWTAMYVAAECFPVQGDRRRRRARECPARHAGDPAARADHRPARLSRALVHQGRRRRAAGGRRMARHAGQGVAMERGHQLRRDRRPLLRLSDLLSISSPTRARSRRCGRRSTASPITSSTTTTS